MEAAGYQRTVHAGAQKCMVVVDWMGIPVAAEVMGMLVADTIVAPVALACGARGAPGVALE